MTGFLERAKRVAIRTGAGPALYRLYSWLKNLSTGQVLANRRIRREGAPDGLPIPPAHLIFLVAATRNVEWFLRSGSAAADSIRAVMAEAGTPLEELDRILDFGCGCGRVLRHWEGLDGPAVEGCDYNPKLVRWITANLSFAEATTNRLQPPLPYDADRFDLVYALSVFTHLDESLHHTWMSELRRVVRPGGFLIITTHGDRHAADLSPEERERYDRGSLVVRNNPFVGTNMCAAYHPERYVREVLAGDMDVLAFRPEGAAGNPHQDLWLLRNR